MSDLRHRCYTTRQISDLYLHRFIGTYCCERCSLAKWNANVYLWKPAEALEHVNLHLARGHGMPDYVPARLEEEVRMADLWSARFPTSERTVFSVYGWWSDPQTVDFLGA